MAIAFRGGSYTATGSDTSPYINIATAVQDDDALYAFVIHTSAITAVPSGWTLVSSPGSCVDGAVTLTLSIYKKDTVLATDSGDVATWTQTSAGAWRTLNVAIDTGGGSATLAETLFTNIDDTATYTITPTAATATVDGELFFAIAAANDTGASDGTPPTGMTAISLSAGFAPARMLNGAYQTRNTGESNSGDWVLSSGAAGSANGLLAVTMRFQPPPQIAGDLTDTLSVAQTEAIAYGKLLADGVGVAPAIRYDVGILVSETLRLTESMLGAGIYPRTLSETLNIAEALVAGMPVSLAETLGMNDAMTLVNGVVIAERLGLAPAVVAAGVYGRTLADQVRIVDSLGRFFSGTLLDQLIVQHSMTPLRIAPANASDTIGLARSVTPAMVFRVIAADEVEFEDAQVINAILGGALAEALEIAALYVAPNGGFTTWAVNSRTGAVTEYDNFVFNSFAQSGRKYLGANSTGVYELNGDDDAGTDIITQIKSGMLQFAGARLASFKAIYLATRGGGDFVLKLETGDGKTFTYNISSNSLQTAKIRVGKGLRARYFSYELISTGQDFDLESLEFVPIVAQRRV